MCYTDESGWVCCYCRKYKNVNSDTTCKGCNHNRCSPRATDIPYIPHPGKTCPQCNQIMTETSEDYEFQHVILTNTLINRCTCGETTVTIPKIEKLQAFLDSHPGIMRLSITPTFYIAWYVTARIEKA